MPRGVPMYLYAGPAAGWAEPKMLEHCGAQRVVVSGRDVGTAGRGVTNPAAPLSLQLPGRAVLEWRLRLPDHVAPHQAQSPSSSLQRQQQQQLRPQSQAQPRTR